MRWSAHLAALALAACAANTEPPPPPAIPPTGMCRPVPQIDIPPRSELEAHGGIGARRIYATSGQLACSEPALGVVECFARGARTTVRIEGAPETIGFDLLDQEGLRIGQDSIVCLPPTER